MYVCVLWCFQLQWSCARGLTSQYCQRQCEGYMSYSWPLRLRMEENRVARPAKPWRCREASRKPRALRPLKTRAIGALAHNFTHWATRAPSETAEKSGKIILLELCIFSAFLFYKYKLFETMATRSSFLHFIWSLPVRMCVALLGVFGTFLLC